MSASDKDATITHLMRELRKERWKVKLLKTLVMLPALIIYRIILGKSLSNSIAALKNEVTESLSSVKNIDLYSAYTNLIEKAPEKLFDLVESIVIWRIRRGIMLLIIASLPTIFLFQQNTIIRKQNDLVTVQNETLSVQTELFRTQTELLRYQTDDEAITRAISDFRGINRVDYPQIERIAAKFDNLDIVRRQDQLNRLSMLYDEGYVNQESFEERREQEQQGFEMVFGRQELLSQYEYLSVFLLISALGENDYANANWVSIFKLDLGNSDFSGADMSQIYLHDCTSIDISGADKSPTICTYPSDDNCP